MKSILSFILVSIGLCSVPVQAEILLGKTPIYAVNYNYASGNVSSGQWVELVHSIPSSISFIEIQDTSGQIMVLGTGASGSEVALPFYVVRGGNDSLLFQINKFKRISIKAASSTGTASTGDILINFFQ